jgi:hypothetical protein
LDPAIGSLLYAVAVPKRISRISVRRSAPQAAASMSKEKAAVNTCRERNRERSEAPTPDLNLPTR